MQCDTVVRNPNETFQTNFKKLSASTRLGSTIPPMDAFKNMKFLLVSSMTYCTVLVLYHHGTYHSHKAVSLELGKKKKKTLSASPVPRPRFF